VELCISLVVALYICGVVVLLIYVIIELYMCVVVYL